MTNGKRRERRFQFNANRAMVRTHHIRVNFGIENIGDKTFVYKGIVDTPTHVAATGAKTV